MNADSNVMNDNVIEATGLVKRFGDFEAVRGVDFFVHKVSALVCWDPMVLARRQPCA